MSTTAVIVLNTLARDEFERDWHGYDEPLSFLDGDLGQGEPIEHLVARIGKTTYRFPAAQVRSVIEGSRERIGWEVEDEAQELWDEDEHSFRFDPSKWWLSDEGKEAKVDERVQEYWQDQLEGEDEWMATLDCRGHYWVETTKEFVAHMEMLMGRVPELTPHILEKLNEVQERCQTVFK